MMKKMLFFALFLLILGAANLSSQVRIGGNGVPNTAAVLDLNATDVVDNGNLGLALPRVSLDTTNTKLNGATPINGMLVYNTNAAMKGGQGAGVYVWVGNKWNSLATSVPVTSITLDRTVLSLPVGTNTTPTATCGPVNATNKTITWSSANPTIASVNASTGRIDGLAVGSVNITATAADGSGVIRTIPVNVWNRVFADSIIGGRTYKVVDLGTAGIWMAEQSREGTPDTTLVGVAVYSNTHKSSACPSPWSLPTEAQIYAYVAVWNSSPQTGWLTSSAMGPDAVPPTFRYGVWYNTEKSGYYLWSAANLSGANLTVNSTGAFSPNRPNYDWYPVRCVR